MSLPCAAEACVHVILQRPLWRFVTQQRIVTAVWTSSETFQLTSQYLCSVSSMQLAVPHRPAVLQPTNCFVASMPQSNTHIRETFYGGHGS